MKFLVLCSILPMAMCLSNKFLSLLDKDKLEEDFETLVHMIGGSDLTRQACEYECHKYAKEELEMNFGCPLACAGLQESLKKWHNGPTHSPAKRTFFDSFLNMETLKADLQVLVDLLGSDDSEQACENECHNLLIQGHVLHYGCDFCCKGFQALINLLDIKPDTTTATARPVGR